MSSLENTFCLINIISLITGAVSSGYLAPEVVPSNNQMLKMRRAKVFTAEAAVERNIGFCLHGGGIDSCFCVLIGTKDMFTALPMQQKQSIGKRGVHFPISDLNMRAA